MQEMAELPDPRGFVVEWQLTDDPVDIIDLSAGGPDREVVLPDDVLRIRSGS